MQIMHYHFRECIITIEASFYNNCSVNVGLGIIVTSNGYIITCKHIVVKKESIRSDTKKVKFNWGEVDKADLVHVSDSHHLAFIKVINLKIRNVFTNTIFGKLQKYF